MSNNTREYQRRTGEANHGAFNIQKATVPITVVFAIVMAGLGWWVNAQEAAIATVANEVEEVQDDVQEQKLEVANKISEIQTQQAVSGTIQVQMLETLRRIETKVDEATP